MFAWLKDYLNKIDKEEEKEKQEKQEKKEKEFKNKNSSINNESPDSQEKKEESKNNKKIKKHKEKRKKKKKKRKKKPSFFFLGIYMIFIIFFVSRILLLKSPENYELDASIEYNQDLRKYEIIYDIEELWNDNNYNVGDKVCIPPYFDRNDAAINSNSSNCISGEVIEVGNKVKIKYNIPKYITKDELDLYIDKESVKTPDYSMLKISFKRFLGLYQIINIIPVNNK